MCLWALANVGLEASLVAEPALIPISLVPPTPPARSPPAAWLAGHCAVLPANAAFLCNPQHKSPSYAIPSTSPPKGKEQG